MICPSGEEKLKHLPGSRDTAIRSFRQPFGGQGVISFAVEFIWAFLAVSWRLMGLVLRQRVRAVQACNPPDVFWPLALLMRALRKPFVFDHHDLSPELYEIKTDQPKGLVSWLLRVNEKLSMRCASWVVSTNESYRQIAIERGGCRPDRVTVVRNGPSATEVTGSATAPVGPRKRIVYLGVINEQDRVDIAVNAAARLAEMRGREGWELVIAGDGECLPALRSMVSDGKLDDVVSFTGWLGGAEVDALLASATIGIQPDPRTRMAELSTMAKTVEYVARGVPVVATDLLETVRITEGAARYVTSASPDEFAKALDEMLDDERALLSMREAGLRLFAADLAWEHQARKYISVWQRLAPVSRTIPQPRADVSLTGQNPPVNEPIN
ncbi:glycosyltransferase involved in cell wall biosynthesis [Allocatelliglobosispora scoriae]|uniref:Glycosyltransferase involved in cell wall biosynthesis n=1 Tax=Allocatelliglobosispora scoriae TaxID=643052 RepID=A0A841BX55_9ACTN|nr:glycosyltransferase involved in cell wall biosynthesis [Allocatelliglobosispora scoriae]